MGDFQKLAVWRKSHALALNVHRTAAGIRKKDQSSLRVQMVRAALSVPTNLVEGTGQRSPKEFARFVRIAINSACELEYHLMVARDIRAISTGDFASLSAQTVDVRKMLHGLNNRLSVSTQRAREKPKTSPPITGNSPSERTIKSSGS